MQEHMTLSNHCAMEGDVGAQWVDMLVRVGPRALQSPLAPLMAIDLPADATVPNVPAWLASALEKEWRQTAWRVAMPVREDNFLPLAVEESMCVVYDNASGVAVTIDFANRNYSIGWPNPQAPEKIFGGPARYRDTSEENAWRHWLISDAIAMLWSRRGG